MSDAAAIRMVLTGRAVPFGRPGNRSAIAKQPAAGAVALGPLGLAGDEQGDPARHGGPDKAVHLYPVAHYPAWRAELPAGAPRDALLAAPGAFGENLALDGVDETTVFVGDLWRAGTALLEVSQARQPCWKLDHRFGLPGMARRVQATGRTGWYGRVREPGELRAGDTMRLEARPHPDWPLARLLQVLHGRSLDRDVLAAMAALPPLAASWRALAARRLERNAVEDWTARLGGPA